MAKKNYGKMGQNSLAPADRKQEKHRRHKQGRQNSKQQLKSYY